MATTRSRGTIGETRSDTTPLRPTETDRAVVTALKIDDLTGR
jgi:hypothetical protein